MEQPPNSGNYTLMDVHGAGCQRSDPKVGDPADYPNGHGPQGDVIRIYNYVRLVRDAGTSSINTNENDKGLKLYPNPAKDKLNINFYESEGEKFSVSVINAFGEVVYRSSDIKTINIEGYDAGIYIVRLESDSRIFAERFIKE